MKSSQIIFTATLLIGLAVAAGTLEADDHGRAYELRRQGDILPLEEIIRRAHRDPDERIIEVELEEKHGQLLYELEFLGPGGVVHERYYDAKTGELVKEKRKKSKKKKGKKDD